MLETIQKTADYLLCHTALRPTIGIILGTGLGGLVKEIQIEKSIPYDDIPDFPVSTVEGHHGRFIFGTIKDVPVVAMQGRFHYYEGYGMDQVTLPVRTMKKMGIETLLVSNASGGLNPDYKIGDIMVITDHINMFGTNPLIGPNIDELGTRFPDMSEAYSKRLSNMALEIGKKEGIKLQQGVYVGTTGPTFDRITSYNVCYTKLLREYYFKNKSNNGCSPIWFSERYG